MAAIIQYKWNEEDELTYCLCDDDEVENFQNSCDALDHLINPETRMSFHVYKTSFKVVLDGVELKLSDKMKEYHNDRDLVNEEGVIL